MKRYFFSTHSHEPTQRYVKKAVTSEHNIVASKFWLETEEDGNEQRISEGSHRSKERRDNIQYEDKEKMIDRSNSKTQTKLLYILLY